MKNQANSMEKMDPEAIKSCCSVFYEDDLVSKVLGDNFHPGGEELTVKLGEKLMLTSQSKVLDVACGTGTSAIILVKHFGCRVTGVDLSEKNLTKAKEKAVELGISDKVEFIKSDAETLQVEDDIFDAVICECALCTFPNKDHALSEMYRVLKPGGRVGITDITLDGELPESLNTILSYVLCITGALPANGYQELLEENSFINVQYEDHSYTLRNLIKIAENLLPAWDLIEKFCNCSFEERFGVTKDKAKEMIKMVNAWLDTNKLGYGLIVGTK